MWWKDKLAQQKAKITDLEVYSDFELQIDFHLTL